VLSEEQFGALESTHVVVLLERGESLASARYPAGAIGVPVGDLVRIRELAQQGPVGLTCRSGVRSAALARLLRAEGLGNVYGLSR